MKFLKLIPIIFCLLPSLVFATFSITPIKVHIKSNEKVASLTLKNSTMERHFQLNLFKVEMKDGHEILHESKDLLITPMQFKLNSDKSQLIRVGKKEGMADANAKYILSIKELPIGEIEPNSIKLVTEFRVPVFIGELPDNSQEKDKMAAPAT